MLLVVLIVSAFTRQPTHAHNSNNPHPSHLEQHPKFSPVPQTSDAWVFDMGKGTEAEAERGAPGRTAQVDRGAPSRTVHKQPGSSSSSSSGGRIPSKIKNSPPEPNFTDKETEADDDTKARRRKGGGMRYRKLTGDQCSNIVSRLKEVGGSSSDG